MMRDAPKVFIDCQTRCYSRYIKQEMTFVHYMRERQNADVFVQITSQRTNAGGRKYNIEYIGQERFEGMRDTINYIVEPNSSEDTERQLILNNIKKGLLPYITQTNLVQELSYNINVENDTPEETTNDPWKLWTFNLRGNFNISGQEAYRNINVNSFLGANKVTNDFKLTTGINYNYDNNFFVLDSNETLTNIITNSGFYATYVKSISDHFSIGFHTDIEENTFSNYDLNASIQPAAEYNFYPWEEANKRQFTIKYRIGPLYNDYIDTTLFNVENELIFNQTISLNFNQIQEWGNLYLNMRYGNFLHDFGLWFASINPNVEFNIVKGLYFYCGGSFSWIRNQINIPKDAISREDVLLRIRQLRSNYRYSVYIGFNYRFGSQISNIVNVRF